MSAEWLAVRTLDGHELEVLRHGPPDGRPLVLHVGTPSAPVQFPAWSDPVIERGWQLVAYARPGYAGSTRREGRTVAAAASDGLDFMAGMGPENGEEYTAAATSRDDLVSRKGA